MTNTVPQNIQDRIDAKILNCIAIAENHFGRPFRFPTVVYETKGTTAGWACDREYKINLNPILLMENIEDFIENTVVHEFAHLVNGIMHPETHISRGRHKKASPHGPTWKAIMILFGVEPSRCHSYNTDTIKARRKPSRKARKHVWESGCGGATVDLTDYKHEFMVAKFITKTGQRFTYVRGYHPNKVGDYRYLGVRSPITGEIDPAPIRPVVKPAAQVKRAAKGSKLSLAINLYRLVGHTKSRKDMIQLLQDELDMSAAGASTYYYKAKKAA